MKKIYGLLAVAALCCCLLSSCDYLDIVPDNTVQITSIYENKDKAYGALAGCYSFLPNPSYDRRTLALAGGEYTTIYTSKYLNDTEFAQGEKIILGQNSKTTPFFDYWSTWHANYRPLYQGIRYCNIFLENIRSVPDLSDVDKDDWEAQVLVLKAYYHFYLTMLYGPIVIADKNFEASDSPELIRQERQPADRCFEYAVELLDKAIPKLPGYRPTVFKGQIDRTVALALKAKVLLFAASPLFNGSADFYSTFKNKAGENMINTTYDKEKWKKAYDAAKEALDYATNEGQRELYYYKDSQPFAYDRNIWNTSEIIKPVYNNRLSIVEPWTSEVVWAYSAIGKGSTLQEACQMRDSENGNNGDFAWNFLGANYSMLEFFYTRNGVPIEEDRNFDYYGRSGLVTVPDDYYHLGFMQPGRKTIKLNLNREPRFYAWLAFDSSVWRDYDRLNYMQMLRGEKHGTQTSTSPDNQYFAGIALKKWVHPESKNNMLMTYYPAPIIRTAELYLMYAEASNEYFGPTNDAYEKLNAVRARAGLKNVEDVYNDPSIVYQTGKHLTKEGLRDIIRRERMIELSFEDQRYHDLRRWKLAEQYFVGPISGFTVSSSTPEEYYQLRTLATMKFVSPRDYLFPISVDELNTNPNLVQNPGW